MHFSVVLLTHYPLSEGPSMALYRTLLNDGLTALGHEVLIRTAKVRLGALARRGTALSKWLGYVDQFLLFPLELRREQRHWSPHTVVLVSDQALGPWVPLINRFRHLVICHDLLALRASRGEFRQQPVGLTGRLYQAWIRWGFRKARRFAAVSNASRSDLARELPVEHEPIAVLNNPLDEGFYVPSSAEVASLTKDLPRALQEQPYLLHIGSNWYKNRPGVYAVFKQLKLRVPQLQLVLVGKVEPSLRRWLAREPVLATAVHLLEGVEQVRLRALYAQAAVLLFPSLFEGFGWPVLEGLACGCPVVTTAVEPLTEVGGDAAVYLPAAPADPAGLGAWAVAAAAQVERVLERSPEEREHWRRKGLAQAARFSRAAWLEQLDALIR